MKKKICLIIIGMFLCLSMVSCGLKALFDTYNNSFNNFNSFGNEPYEEYPMYEYPYSEEAFADNETVSDMDILEDAEIESDAMDEAVVEMVDAAEVAATFEKILRGEAPFINTANDNVETYIYDVTIIEPPLDPSAIDKVPHGMMVTDVDADGYKDLILHFLTSDVYDYDMTMILPFADTIYGYNQGSRVGVHNNGLVSYYGGAYYTGDSYNRLSFEAGVCSGKREGLSTDEDPYGERPTLYYIEREEVSREEYMAYLEEHKAEYLEPTYYEFNEENINIVIDLFRE